MSSYTILMNEMKHPSSLSKRPGSTSLGSASSIQAAVRQLEAEADAIIQMVREGQRARRLQQAPPPTASSASVAAAAGSSVVVPHAPTGAAPPAGTAAATVSMGCTDSRHTCTHTHTAHTYSSKQCTLIT